VRWIAVILLTSCAPAAIAIPSSLPFVRVDPALPGAVMSRDAAIVVVQKRIDDALKCAGRVTDCETRATQAEHERDEQTKLARTNGWWRAWGPMMILTGVVTAFAAGFAGGFGAAPRR
jgi:hypothetical protein